MDRTLRSRRKRVSCSGLLALVLLAAASVEAAELDTPTLRSNGNGSVSYVREITNIGTKPLDVTVELLGAGFPVLGFTFPAVPPGLPVALSAAGNATPTGWCRATGRFSKRRSSWCSTS